MSLHVLSVLMTFLSISVQLPMDVNVRVYVSELDLGIKKDVFSSDGSSLEALLKGEPLDKRSGLELRTAEEEPSSTEYSTGGLNPSSRVRKVLGTLCYRTGVILLFFFLILKYQLKYSFQTVFTLLCV